MQKHLVQHRVMHVGVHPCHGGFRLHWNVLIVILAHLMHLGPGCVSEEEVSNAAVIEIAVQVVMENWCTLVSHQSHLQILLSLFSMLQDLHHYLHH